MSRQSIDVHVDSAIRVVDSHTGGEPTRVVVEGAPQFGGGDMASRRAVLGETADWLRTALVAEPRGSNWMVGAVLQPPLSCTAAAGVIFFNNAGYLGMCGHGLMGVVATLAYLGRIGPGRHTLETPVGDVAAELHSDGEISVENVPCYRRLKDVVVDVPGIGAVTGDVAWGGNWFFLSATDRLITPTKVAELTDKARRIRQALSAECVTGDDRAEIDHIELFGPPSDHAVADARGFVLCPGGEYDRSPCGTGLSAKLACLAADGRLAPGQIWRQESIIGSIFTGHYRPHQQGVVPTITGRAFVQGDVRLVIDPSDPYRFGIK